MPARIPQLERSDLQENHKPIYDAVVATRGTISGPFRIWLHSPEFADRAQRLGQFVRYDTSLPARLSELAILVCARFMDCQVEWSLHEQAALDGGLTVDVIDSIRHRRDPELIDDEQAVFDYSSELLATRQISDSTFAKARSHLADAQLVELTGIIGYYCTVAMTLNVFQVPLPEGTRPTLVDCPTFSSL